MRQRQDVLASGSYISSNDRRPALRPGRCDGCGHGGDSLAVGQKETVKLPAVDRIYTITEGKGITGAIVRREALRTIPKRRMSAQTGAAVK